MMRIKTHQSILFILTLALLLRLPLLNGSFWLDEAAQALESARPLSQQLLIVDDFQPPLLHLVLHFAMYVSQQEWWLRLMGAVIPGLASIYATYVIGKKLISEKAGLAAALLLATSSFHIFYSQELRPYALPTLWATFSWLALLNWLETKETKQHWWANPSWWGLVITTTLGLYTSYLYPFLVLSQLLYTAIAVRKKLVSVISSFILAGLAFVPLLPLFFQQLQAGGQVRTNLPGWAEVVSIPQLKAIPLVFGKFVFGVLDLSLNPLFMVLTTLLAGLILGSVYQAWLKQKSLRFLKQTKWLVPLCWLLVPLIFSWLVSFWIPVVRPKRLLMLLPAFYLVVSTLIFTLKPKDYKKIGLALFSLLLTINIIGTGSYYTQPQLQRENWRAAYAELVTKYPPQQSIAVFAYIAPFSPFAWYDQADYPILATGTLHITQKPDLRTWLEPITNYRFVIVFDYLRDLTDPDDTLIKEIQAYDYQLVDLIDYPNIGFIRIFAKQESTLGQRKP